eukprot:353447-Chlamydomonas_euryale.AAC.4
MRPDSPLDASRGGKGLHSTASICGEGLPSTTRTRTRHSSGTQAPRHATSRNRAVAPKRADDSSAASQSAGATPRRARPRISGRCDRHGARAPIASAAAAPRVARPRPAGLRKFPRLSLCSRNLGLRQRQADRALSRAGGRGER